MSANGSWDVVVKTPMGEQKSVLTMKVEGGELTGSMAGPSETMPLQNGVVDGDNLSWAMDMTVPFPMKLEAKATVSGDSISGTVKAGMLGASPMTGQRKT